MYYSSAIARTKSNALRYGFSASGRKSLKISKGLITVAARPAIQLGETT